MLSRLPEVERFLDSHPDVIFAYLFGSLSRGSKKPPGDVDIAVYLAHRGDFGEKKMELLGALADILQTDDIDLIVLNTTGLPLAMNVLKNKRVLVDKEPFKRHAFESLTMRKYFDFSIKEAAQLRRRYLSG
jgi:predicted nucleotidyltransferase